MTKDNSQIELYFIRHAEAVMNTNPHLIGGRSNETPLTEKGMLQAQQLGEAMLAKQLVPKKIFVSPALRTLDTARYALGAMGIDIAPSIEEAIQELSQGTAEGIPKAAVYTDEVLRDIERLGKDFKLNAGESMNDVGIRMYDWVTRTIPPDPVRYFIFTHGGAIKYLASYLCGWDHRQTYETEIDNASINLFTISHGVCEVAYLNRNLEQL
jgi:broad specificity phosphatase PhoE